MKRALRVFRHVTAIPRATPLVHQSASSLTFSRQASTNSKPEFDMTNKNYVGEDFVKETPEVINKTRSNVFDLFSLKGKVASISGSSGGIGYDVAEAFAQAGADVAIWYNSRDPSEKVKHLESSYGIKAKAYKVAINDYNAVESAIKQQISDFGKIDIFVANAGVIWEGGNNILDEEDNTAWDKVMKINVDGVYYCAKAVGRHFRERGTGNFIITGSMSGHIINVPDTMIAYTTSKAAVNHLTKGLALEWIKFARVNSVSPGYIKSVMTEEKERENAKVWGPITPMGRMADSRELVGAYLYLASDASTYVTGADIRVDGGYTAM